ncbi:MAG: hypothetical protein AMJ92_10470 [candidate division Zixibacteria bacterium SM23_81]|nr:MAG: hypothetical protein AMJ92_10470 [candidate division Zixibacteria bacterium SM23_81]
MVLAIVAFIIAAIPTFGLVLKEDPVGRIISAAVWVLIGIGWLGHLIPVKKSDTSNNLGGTDIQS